MKKRSAIALPALMALLVLLFSACQEPETQSVHTLLSASTFSISGYDEDGFYTGNSTGAVITADGGAVTAFHCVNQYGAEYYATFSDGTQCAITQLLAVDVNRDIAIVRLDGDAFTPLQLRADPLPLGATVYTLGNTKGVGLTLTEGLHSAMRPDANNEMFFQHSTSISSGNSGGPIVDENGQLVAVHKSSMTNADDLNNGTPVQEIVALMESMPDENEEARWGDSFTGAGFPFTYREYTETGYYSGAYSEGAFNGLVWHRRYEGSLTGQGNVYRGEFRDGQPYGYIIHNYKDAVSDSDVHTDSGEFVGYELNGRGLKQHGKNYERGVFQNGKLNDIGLLVEAGGDIYYGGWKDGVRNGRATLIQKGTWYLGDYKDGEWQDWNISWLPVVQEGIVYQRLSPTQYHFWWEPVPGARDYLLYYRLEGETAFTPVTDDDGNMKRYAYDFLINEELNTLYIARDVHIESEGRPFYVAVQPLVNDDHYQEMQDGKALEGAAEPVGHTVHAKALALKNDSYYLYSDDPFAYIYTVDSDLSTFEAPYYLGNLASTSLSGTYNIFNTYGMMGAETAQRSIWNRQGKYGSADSQFSAFNPTAANPPKIYNSSRTFVGYLTKNDQLQPAFDPDEIFELLQAAGV